MSRSEQRKIAATIGEFRVTETGEVFLRVYYKNDPQRRFKLLRKEEVEEQNGCTIQILMSEDFPQCNALAQTGAVQAVPVQSEVPHERVSQNMLADAWRKLKGLFGS